MIIEKWAKLKDNYLDSNFEFTSDKSKKLDLTTLLKRSIDSFTESNNFNTLIQATENIDCSFKKAYDQYPIILKIISLFCKTIGTTVTLPQYYEKLIAKINCQITENYRGNIKGLLEDTTSFINQQCNENPEKDLTFISKFIDKSFFQAVENIQKRTLIKGIFYEITNQFNCKSYLIGTIHTLPDASISSIPNFILEKIQDSEELITEVGNDIPSDNSNTLDAFLTNHASKHGVIVRGLETQYFQKNLLFKQQELLNNPTDRNYYMKFSAKKMSRFLQLKQVYHLVLQIQEAWQNGDVSELKLLVTNLCSPEIKNLLFKERNRQWLENSEVNLLDKLQNSEKPISIAIGAGHLFGKTGLLKAFQDTGTLQVRQII